MTAWMLYSVGTSTVIALAAMFLEYGLRGRGVTVRWVWVAALAGSVTISLAPWVAHSSRPVAAEGPRLEIVSGAFTPDAGQAVGIESGAGRRWPFDRLVMPAFPQLDRIFLGVALILGATGLAVLVSSHRRLARRRRSWRATVVDGTPAYIARSMGPAVVGFISPAIVLPEWVLGMDERRRRLVITHEQEHLHARDNQLLGIATLIVVLMPWNAALWWQLRRLRQGVELDCDRRVLTREPCAAPYGELLIEMGRRSSTRAFAFAAFAESSSFLDRRIRSIAASRPRRAGLLFGTFAALALASFLFVWAPPSPRPIAASVVSLPASRALLTPGTLVPKATSTDGGFSTKEAPAAEKAPAEADAVGQASAPAPITRVEATSSEAVIARRPRVEELVQRDYPEIFSDGMDINEAIWFAIDRNGEIRKSWIGPNLYINVGASGSVLREFELPAGSRERAAAEAEHQRLEQEILQANVPELEIRSMYAGYFSGGGGSAVVHFVTEHPGAGNWGRFRVASAFVADAVDSALGP